MWDDSRLVTQDYFKAKMELLLQNAAALQEEQIDIAGFAAEALDLVDDDSLEAEQHKMLRKAAKTVVRDYIKRQKA